ncbi:MAG: NAD-dependent epimerase/dehydratase family protein [Deltaproteobacteria bacterium]|nr:NAD-dependent epimerase/dehydratase family protein [Deltaproteobacteria bacterium]
MPRAEYKKALVTGGAGFIGSHIVQRLVDLGIEVSVIDDLSMGRIENLDKGVRFFHGNILDSGLLKRSLHGVEVVFHNAARVSIRNSFDAIYADAETNVMGTVNLLKESGLAGIKKFIYASSMAVYSEGKTAVLGEEHPKRPASPYGVSKLAGEMYTERMAAHYGFQNIVLRYFNTFGPKQTLTPYVGVITIFINNLLAGKAPVIYGDGSQVRDFIFVEDIAQANIIAMQSLTNNCAVNVGTGKGTSVAEIARMLIEKINPGIEPEYARAPEGEPKDSIALVSTAKDLLGFEAKFALKDKIDTVIEWNRISAEKRVN